jgi:phosphoribosylformylglycinamidine synthase
VSFYNATGDAGIHPTPVVGVLGVLRDVAVAVGQGFAAPGDVIVQVGAPTRPGLGGSAYLWRVQGRLAGRPPAVDLDEEAALHRLLVAAAEGRILRSAHDVSAGGLLASAVESCLAGPFGAALSAEPDVATHQWLFSESPTRVLVSVSPAEAPRLASLCHEHGVYQRIAGTVTAEPSLDLGGQLMLDLAQVRSIHEDALPAVLEGRRRVGDHPIPGRTP